MTDDTLTAARRRFLLNTGLLDAQWYVEQLPAARGAADPVAHYLEHGAREGLAPNPELDALQAAGLRTGEAETTTGLRHVPPPDDPTLLQEAELVRASGLFDPDFYLEQKPELREARGADLVLHFCRSGWRNLLRPYRGFDTWWYWMSNLDPGVEAMNPFIHYLLVGTAAGHSPLPVHPEKRDAWRPPDGGPRRVCLFAGFDRDGLVDDYVVDYVRELSRFADVYYLADNDVDPAELEKLADVTVGAWGVRHGAYDFGSWSMLARDLVGWETIDRYDELLLVNDSCYLLRALDEVFAQMDATACDWWGMQATKGLSSTSERARRQVPTPVPMAEALTTLVPSFETDAPYDFHVGSYFLAFRRPVLGDGHLRRLLDSVHNQRTKLLVILKYEAGLTHYLLGNGFRLRTFVEHLYPFHPVFTQWYFAMLEQGFPLLKKYLLYQNHYDVPDLRDWKRRVLAEAPDAPVETFERNLRRTAPADALTRSFAVVTRPDGTVHVPQLAQGQAFRRQDRATRADPSRWVFLSSSSDSWLSPNARAIYEHVRLDPSITKVVLTRGRTVTLSGANVVHQPLRSEEGQAELRRSGRLLLDGLPRLEVGRLPVDWRRHQPVVVRRGLALSLFGRAVADPTAPPHKIPTPVVRGMLCSSDLDQLAMLAAQAPIEWEHCWRTGLPATDLLLCERAALPDDVRDQEDRLRAELGSRRLLLFAPDPRRGRADGEYHFESNELMWLSDWCRRHDAVIGLRGTPGSVDPAYLKQLRGHVLNLPAQRYPDNWPLLRCADAMWTDTDGMALDFLATGRPVVSFLHHLQDIASTTFYPPEHVMPGPVCRTFEELTEALDAVFDAPGEDQQHRYRRVQRLFFDHLDTSSSARAVERIKALPDRE